MPSTEQTQADSRWPVDNADERELQALIEEARRRARRRRAGYAASLIAALLLAGGIFALSGGGNDGPGSPTGSGGDSPQPGAPSPLVSAHGVSARVPTGWRIIRKPIDGVINPVHALVAASYPVKIGAPAPGCHPGRVLDQRPAGGALVMLFEYGGRPNLERFPPRSTPFELTPSTYAPHECAGPSYNIFFRDHGRAFQAWVILDRDSVNPRVRAQAIQLMDSLRFEPKA